MKKTILLPAIILSLLFCHYTTVQAQGVAVAWAITDQPIDKAPLKVRTAYFDLTSSTSEIPSYFSTSLTATWSKTNGVYTITDEYTEGDPSGPHAVWILTAYFKANGEMTAPYTLLVIDYF